MSSSFHLHSSRGGSALAVHVVPRAKRNEIVQISNDGSVKIRLNTPADQEVLNANLVAFLARVLEVKASSIEVVAGEASLSKLVSVLDLNAEVVHRRILKHLI